ncbi:MAG: hypothetical protein LBU80_01125 [Rikenellaceae bacterium]|jgi:hypothetical protein|nr:hypothetical protein [Rikenellaceae bacterium]
MEKDTTIHDRISQMVDYYGDGKNTVFAKIVDESEANVRGYRINVIPKQPFLEKVVKSLDVSPEWLLTGNGSMLRDERPEQASEPTVVHERDPRDIQLIATQAELIAMLRDRVSDLEKGSKSVGLGSARSAAGKAIPGTHHTK